MHVSDINQLLNQPERDSVQLADSLAEYRAEHFESFRITRDCEMRFKVNLPPLLSCLILLAILQNLTSSARGKFTISFFLSFIMRLTQNSLNKHLFVQVFLIFEFDGEARV